jgi:hypothetical protein
MSMVPLPPTTLRLVNPAVLKESPSCGGSQPMGMSNLTRPPLAKALLPAW